MWLASEWYEKRHHRSTHQANPCSFFSWEVVGGWILPEPLRKLPMADREGIHCDSVQCLVDAGVVQCAQDEFGEVFYGINPSKVRISAQLQHMWAGPLVRKAVEFGGLDARQSTSKLGLAMMLQKQGWACTDAPIASRAVDAPLELSSAWVASGPKPRLAALLLQDGIFAKGIFCMYLKMPMNYFMCLLKLKDLTPLETLGADVLGKTDKFFKMLLRNEGFVEDGDVVADDGDILAAGPGAPLVDAVAAQVHEMPRAEIRRVSHPSILTPARPVVLQDGELQKVYFDGFSHASGRLRAFVECWRHAKCRLCRYADAFDSHAVCCAHLAAWLEAGHFPDIDSAGKRRVYAVAPERVAHYLPAFEGAL